MQPSDFLGGVVEGFYGPPWSMAQRRQLFGWMQDWGLNTYFYAPKDDLNQRALWRQPYEDQELEKIQSLVRACGERRLTFVYGLSPGLDIAYSQPSETDVIRRRFTQLLDAGCDSFGLLFDDIPGALSTDGQRRFDSFAHAQSVVANDVFRWLRTQRPHARCLFCPTPYCDRMDRWQIGGSGYLETIGRQLDPAIDILWTGPEIVSAEIPVASIRALQERIRRPPVIWDNLHANDYDGRRLYCGPYSGRPRELRDAVRGILSNPNTEFAVNYVPLRTFAEFLQGAGPWEPRRAYAEAMRQWLAEYATVREPFTLEDLLLLGDCFYLPFEEGPEAEQLVTLLRRLVREQPATWGDAHRQFVELNRRIQRLFERLTELRQRDLFYGWSRRAWDLKEEMQLFDVWCAAKAANPGVPDYASEGHLPGTYRGGLITRIQRLLHMSETGRFRADPTMPSPDVPPPSPSRVDWSGRGVIE